MNKVKLLLYCTKAKPYLRDYRGKAIFNRFVISPENKPFTSDDKQPILNGTIVAECEVEIEEHKETTIDWLCMSLREKITFGNMCEKANIDELECYEYANGKPLYALHISNLHIFDTPKELNDYCLHEIVDNVFFNEKEIKKAPQNMCRVYDKKLTRTEKGDGYVLISIRPQWLCKILNGEKDIEVRREVLNCMKEK